MISYTFRHQTPGLAGGKARQNLIVDFYLLGLSIARRLRLEVKALEIIADSSDASFLLRRLDFLHLPGHAHSSIVSTF